MSPELNNLTKSIEDEDGMMELRSLMVRTKRKSEKMLKNLKMKGRHYEIKQEKNQLIRLTKRNLDEIIYKIKDLDCKMRIQ